MKAKGSHTTTNKIVVGNKPHGKFKKAPKKRDRKQAKQNLKKLY